MSPRRRVGTAEQDDEGQAGAAGRGGSRGGGGGPGGGPAADPELGEPGRNEVVLVGRLSAPVEERTLPSGDVLATWRLVVDRPPAARPRREGVRPVTVDTLDCIAWSGRLRQSARRLRPGDVVRVEGALRRRFWRAGPGAASRCEVEVNAVERLSRPGPSA